MSESFLKSAIREAALELGFDYMAVSSLTPPAREARALREWCLAGYQGGMDYMARTQSVRTHPVELLPGAQSLLTLCVSYFSNDPASPPSTKRVWGRVARYAWGLDYHDVIRERLTTLCSRIETIVGRHFSFRTTADAQPLLERAYAYGAGMGFYGKNTNIIVPGGGSWMFLAEAILDIPLEPDSPLKLQGCGSCALCVEACPTGALSGDYRMDARKCISYLTIENKGAIPRDLRPAIGSWIFGCDLCQECCPFNARVRETRWPEFSSRHGSGPWLDLREVLSLRTPLEFKTRFRGTPLTRPKRKGLLRNACVAAGNLKSEELIAPLCSSLKEDVEPLVRGHAAWALGQYSGLKARKAIDTAWLKETDSSVREEIELALSLPPSVGEGEDGGKVSVITTIEPPPVSSPMEGGGN